MKVYEYLTIKFSNLDEVKTVLKKFNNSQINIIWSFESLSWQGPHMMKQFNLLLNDKRINFIAEVGENIGLALTLIELEIKKISVSTNLDKNLREKIESLAKKQGIDVLITQRFKKIQTISELMRDL
jgi:hypothetical protein|tara:strand:- start:2308 stop:2688 length:381 start_codon:yes stop_codon:yes gene_type:complete